MYEKIKNRPLIAALYAQALMEQGIAAERIAEIEQEITTRLEEAIGRKAIVSEADMPRHGVRSSANTPTCRGDWRGEAAYYFAGREAGAASGGVHSSPKISTLQKKRSAAVVKDEAIDWGNGEALAFASLLSEGTSVRLSGQDVRRGTFSQRHAAVFDMQTEAPFTPLSSVTKEGAVFSTYDSMLSEYAVLGFEYGYSLESPDALIMWEAQYGDFANGAQVVIDQFISSGESKWGRATGLVMLLTAWLRGAGTGAFQCPDREIPGAVCRQ